LWTIDETGVMKAKWDRADLRGMLQHPLSFAAVDIALVQAHLVTAQ
jgi:hypothetical protein